MPLFVTHMQRLQLKQTVFPYQLNVPAPKPVTTAPFPIQMLRVRLGVLQKKKKKTGDVQRTLSKTTQQQQ